MTSPLLHVHAALEPARDRRQVEVLREHRAAAVGDAHELPAAIRVDAALHAVDDAVVDGVHVLAPDLAAEIDAAVAVAALRGAIARAHGAEHARIADGMRRTGPASG